MARAALGLHRLGTRSGRRDPQTVSALDRATAALDGQRSVLRARVLAALARDLHHGMNAAEMSRAGEVAEQAVALAGQLGEPGTLATCLLARHDAGWAPGTARDRLSVIEEMVGCATAADDRELAAQAVLLRAGALLELGDPRSRAELEGYCRRADALGHR